MSQVSDVNTEFTSLVDETESEQQDEKLTLAMFQEKQDQID